MAETTVLDWPGCVPIAPIQARIGLDKHNSFRASLYCEFACCYLPRLRSKRNQITIL